MEARKTTKKYLWVIILSEKSMRKLFKINQVSCFETKQTKKGFACFWQHRSHPRSRNYNCSPRGYAQIKARAWRRQVCPSGILGMVTRPCMALPAGYSTGCLQHQGPFHLQWPQVYAPREQRGQSKGCGSTRVWAHLWENPTQWKNAGLVPWTCQY